MIYDQLKCGGCGNDKLTLWNVRVPDEGRDYFVCIEIRCECGVKTRIEPQPHLSVTDTDDSPGGICGGWGS